MPREKHDSHIFRSALEAHPPRPTQLPSPCKIMDQNQGRRSAAPSIPPLTTDPAVERHGGQRRRSGHTEGWLRSWEINKASPPFPKELGGGFKQPTWRLPVPKNSSTESLLDKVDPVCLKGDPKKASCRTQHNCENQDQLKCTRSDELPTSFHHILRQTSWYSFHHKIHALSGSVITTGPQR